MTESASEAPVASFNDITPDQWKTLAERRIFFGHQSVGGNVMDGVAELIAGDPRIPLRVAEATTLDSSAGAGLFHARVGTNGDIGSKSEAFASATRSLSPSVALLKYCYVDITGASDPELLFREYRDRMLRLRAENPDLIIVHSTMPLTDLEGRREWLMAKVRGGDTKRDLNLIRSRYNELLRAEYVGKEPVFDIARIESTLADGTRTFFRSRGRDVPFLAPALTDDGGHLNADGRRAAAEQLLALLASL